MILYKYSSQLQLEREVTGRKNLKIKSLKVAALKNLTNLQPHLSAIHDCLE